MPVNENSYQNGKLYRIWSLKTDSIYVGSSCDTLSHRFCKHKSHYKKWNEGDKRRYCSSFILFDEVGFENCKIELIKNFPCNSKAELNREEGKVMREYKDILVNKRLAGRTKKEHSKIYREEHKEQIKEFYEHNKKEILEKNKEYRDQNKEQISKQKKEYYEIHKEEYKEQKKEYNKEYRQEHKEEINKKYDCSCGGKYRHQSISIHNKTKRHQNYLKSQ